jgi:predicted transcriptional regulator
MPRSLYQRLEQPQDDGLNKLLGPLESAIMEVMWARQAATVRDVASALQAERDVAYTTIMTVMINLADKGLLRRTPLDKRTHLYEVVVTRDAFLQQSSARVVQALVRDFGDFALAEFAVALETITPEQRQRIRRRMKERAARQRREEGDAG